MADANEKTRDAPSRPAYLHNSPEFAGTLLKLRLNKSSYIAFYANIIGYGVFLLAALFYAVTIGLKSSSGPTSTAGSFPIGITGTGLALELTYGILWIIILINISILAIAFVCGISGLLKPNPSQGRAIIVALMPFFTPLLFINLAIAIILHDRLKNPTRREEQAADAMGIAVPEHKSKTLERLKREGRIE
ncbi:MAG: hypothetical protein E3J72_08685 [Planctomycetota bacterium]|nr:MAG: hypothetical protein E3J72_08685 [Planctomycetota bacterium]